MEEISLTPRALGDTGGEENHVLTIAEIPSHQHKFSALQAEGGGDFGAAYGTASILTATTTFVGGNEPHNLLPPFIALTFCEKGE